MLLIIYQGYLLLSVPIIFTTLLFIIDQYFIEPTICNLKMFYSRLYLCMRNNIDKGFDYQTLNAV